MCKFMIQNDVIFVVLPSCSNFSSCSLDRSLIVSLRVLVKQHVQKALMCLVEWRRRLLEVKHMKLASTSLFHKAAQLLAEHALVVWKAFVDKMLLRKLLLGRFAARCVHMSEVRYDHVLSFL